MIRRIVTYPDPFLRKPTREISADRLGGPEIISLVSDALDTLDATDDGAALSANQIGISERFFVIGKKGKLPDGTPSAIFNPRVTSTSSDTLAEREGCLSFPGVSVVVRRPVGATVAYQTILGESREIKLDGWWARLFQHEIDHLDGRLFVDQLSGKRKIEIVNILKRRR